MAVQQFCLRWNNHQPNFISVFSNLLNNESLVDVTLAAEGRHLQAHKVILSACSSYFQSLFMANPCQHPIVILKDVNFIDLKTMVDFMYYGEVNVSQEQLPHILKTAEMLKIKGLAEMPDTTLLSKSHSTSSDKTDLLKLGESNYSTEIQRQSMSPSPCSLSPSARRKRLRKTSLGSGSGSTEQTSEEHPNEISVSSPGDSGVSTVTTKMELNTSFTLDGNTTRHTTIKQHSSTDSDTIRNAPKQQSMEHEHDQHNISHISLQISQPDMSTPQHSDNQLVGVPGPSVPASTSHPASQGPWTLVEHPTYPCFTLSSCQTDMQGLQSQCMQYMPGMAPSCAMEEIKVAPASPCPSVCPSPCSSPKVQQQQPTVKRKRSVNPQADENFTKALDAVRFGGIGFCKAARMYGVNNRTLWLEYKKRGYPISRSSIKARVKQQTQAEMDSPVEQQQQPICATAPPLVSDIIGGFMNQRHVEFVPDVQRSPVLGMNQLNLHGVNFGSVG